jgi:hypothetical protein
VKSLRGNLNNDCDDENCRENYRANEIPKIHRHGHCVSGGLAQRSGSDLDDPEDDGYLWNFG